MTDLQVVYDAFLAKQLDDEWTDWTDTEMHEDWKSMLMAAISSFKFPRVSLDIVTDPISGAEKFESDLNNDEIQILATYMKCEWLNRAILTWENIKPLYEERDFSQANLLDKFRQMLEEEHKTAARREAKYYRSISRQPFDYTQLATSMNG